MKLKIIPTALCISMLLSSTAWCMMPRIARQLPKTVLARQLTKPQSVFKPFSSYDFENQKLIQKKHELEAELQKTIDSICKVNEKLKQTESLINVIKYRPNLGHESNTIIKNLLTSAAQLLVHDRMEHIKRLHSDPSPYSDIFISLRLLEIGLKKSPEPPLDSHHIKIVESGADAMLKTVFELVEKELKTKN